MSQIFLSHTSKDNNLAKKIHDDLEAADLKVWLDLEDIKPSDDYSAAIHNDVPPLVVPLSMLVQVDNIG